MAGPASRKKRGAEPGTDAIRLPAALDALAAPALLDRLRQATGSGRVTLDGSAVEVAATGCIQILLAASRVPDAEGGFRLTDPSPSLAAAFGDLGLKQHLDEWMARDG